jgi:hypothetical protein
MKDKKMSEEFNMSMRKFLKQVGVSSQQAIENALRDVDTGSGKTYEAKMVLTIQGLDLEHEIIGKIEG